MCLNSSYAYQYKMALESVIVEEEPGPGVTVDVSET